MKLECPMLTSTEPCEEFRPTVTVLCRITNSKSLPSNRARARGREESGMGVIPPAIEERGYMDGTRRTGLQGADFSANKARAPVSSPKSAIFSENAPGIAPLSTTKRNSLTLAVGAEKQHGSGQLKYPFRISWIRTLGLHFKCSL